MRRLAVVLVALAALACADKADRLAKARIFSPEGPSEEELEARAKLPLEKAPTDPAVYARVVRMDRSEAIRRLGGQHATTTVKERWTNGSKTVALTEKDELFADANGDFRAVSTNDQDAGLEVVFAGGEAYAKSRYGPFHRRRLDQAGRDVWLSRATSGLPTLDELCLGRLHLVAEGAGELAGRATEKFALQLGPKWIADPNQDLPPVVYGQYADADGKLHPGPDPDTSRRLMFEEKRVPEAVTGELEVDRKTGVVLAARAEARFTVPALAGEKPASLELGLDFALAPEASLRVAPPKDVVDAKLPRPPADPLWFLGDGENPETAAPTR